MLRVSDSVVYWPKYFVNMIQSMFKVYDFVCHKHSYTGNTGHHIGDYLNRASWAEKVHSVKCPSRALFSLPRPCFLYQEAHAMPLM